MTMVDKEPRQWMCVLFGVEIAFDVRHKFR